MSNDIPEQQFVCRTWPTRFCLDSAERRGRARWPRSRSRWRCWGRGGGWSREWSANHETKEDSSPGVKCNYRTIVPKSLTVLHVCKIIINRKMVNLFGTVFLKWLPNSNDANCLSDGINCENNWSIRKIWGFVTALVIGWIMASVSCTPAVIWILIICICAATGCKVMRHCENRKYTMSTVYVIVFPQ